MTMKKVFFIIIIILFFIEIGYTQSPFRRDYYERISTYQNQYTRTTMFAILDRWLDEASGLGFDCIHYSWTIYTQREKQNYAWTIERGTKGLSNSGGLYHYITFFLSNGEFTIYFPPENSSLRGYRRFRNEDLPSVFNSFIRESIDVLRIFNDNYGRESLDQLNRWSNSMTGILRMIQWSHSYQRNGYDIFGGAQ